MRISDWSSDVCSSDLSRPARAGDGARIGPAGFASGRPCGRRGQVGKAALVNGCAHGDQHRGSAPFEILIGAARSEEHTSELQSLMRISYAVFCLKKKTRTTKTTIITHTKIASQHNKIAELLNGTKYTTTHSLHHYAHHKIS